MNVQVVIMTKIIYFSTGNTFSLGAHINPSITLGMAVIRAISPLRAAMYITAQCGGGIAGAALLYG